MEGKKLTISGQVLINCLSHGELFKLVRVQRVLVVQGSFDWIDQDRGILIKLEVTIHVDFGDAIWCVDVSVSYSYHFNLKFLAQQVLKWSKDLNVSDRTGVHADDVHVQAQEVKLAVSFVGLTLHAHGWHTVLPGVLHLINLFNSWVRARVSLLIKDCHHHFSGKVHLCVLKVCFLFLPES